LDNWSAAVCHVLLRGFATFLLLTGGVLPSFFSAVLVFLGLLILIWFWCYGTWSPLVVGDFAEFAEVEMVLGVFALGVHCVPWSATSGVNWGEAI